MDNNSDITTVEYLKLSEEKLYEKLEVETDSSMCCELAVSMAEVREAVNKSKELEVRDKELEVQKRSDTLKFLGSVGAALITAAGLIAVAVIKNRGHQEGIDRVASYENDDVIFTGKKFGEISRLD